MPGFACIAALSIAFGTGANVAMFSAVDANLLRPLPVPHPSDLLTVGSPFNIDNLSYSALFASYPDYLDIQERARGFQGLTVFTHSSVGFSRGAGEPAQARLAAVVSSNFFDVVGVAPALGGSFHSDEEGAVVLSHAFWQEQFLGTPEALGRHVQIGTQSFVVIGVAPE